MIGVDKILVIRNNIEVGINMIELYHKVQKEIKSYSYLIRIMKHLAGKKAIVLKKVGRSYVVEKIDYQKFLNIDVVTRLAT